MKRTIRLFTVAAMLAVFAAPVLAQTNGPKECNDETKSTLYTKYYENLPKGAAGQAVSYAAAKEYLATCPTDDDQYTKALKKFIGLYDAATRKSQFEDAYAKKNYAEVINLGKQVLADDPNNPHVYILMGVAGYNAAVAGNTSLAPESAEYAKKAMEMIESGNPPKDWAPFTGKDQTLAWLNYSIGKAKLTASPADALPYLVKAARYESELKKNPQTYEDISSAYERGPRAQLSDDYERLYKDKPATPESELAAANINQVIDRQIDALARAAALSVGNEAAKKAYMDVLIGLYKYRNKSDAGVNELVAGILSKPVPDVPTPLMSLPTPAPTPTPVATGSQTGTPATATSGTQANKGGTTTTGQPQSGNKATGTAKPTPTPVKTPAKPRARANHRRRG
jgi:hypothetical protein